MEKHFNLSSLEKAIASLSEIIERYNREPHDSAVRDAAIQRFEYTYELSIKIMVRYLSETLPSKESVKQMSFQNIIRKADEVGLLLNNLEKWMEYRQKRNITSHTYDEAKAIEVVSILPDFEADVLYLLMELRKRIV